MTDKCPDCPLLDGDRPCLAQLTRHPRYCRPEYRSIVLAYENPCPEEASETERNRESIKQHLSLIARVKACPNWVASSSCGCGANKCLAGKGRQGIVVHQDCFACLREADSLTEPPRPSTEDPGS